jgi:chromosome segregation ATPase
MEDLRRRLAECEVLLAEADRGGEQVNAELQQFREQVQTLTMERDHEARKAATLHNLAEMSRRQVEDEAGKVEQLKERVQKLERELKAERDSGMLALRSQNRLGQEALAEALQTWLRPVIELVAEYPDDASSLAVAVLGFLPGIASRLIEE